MRKPHIVAKPAHFALAVALAAAGVVLWVPPASAASCLFDAQTRHATVAVADTASLVIIRSSGANLLADENSCGALNAIDSVTVDMQAASSALVVFDLSGGPLGPGFTAEVDSSSEIEFSIIGLGLDSGRLHVLGSAGPDEITLGEDTGHQINLNAAVDAASPDVDVVFTSNPLELRVDGRAGDDTLSAAGVLGTASPYGGRVTLIGGSGSNQLTGGIGNDRLLVLTEVTSTGSDDVAGGNGFDVMEIETESANLQSTYSIDGLANDGVGCPGIECEGDNVGTDVEGILGSAGRETLIGSSQGDVLAGRGGNDVLRGLDGFDNLQCAGGKAIGGPMDDALLASPGCASVSGGPGRDEVSFADSPDGVTVTVDGLKNDGLPGALVNVRLDVENLYGTAFADSLTGSDKRNRILGSTGRDVLVGGAGNDRVEGHNGNDTLLGGPNDDRLLGGPGNDDLDGGDGIDVCSQGAGAGLEANCE